MQQLVQRSNLIKDAGERNFCLQNKAMDAYNQRHTNCMKHREYAKGELVLVYDEALENQMSRKGTLRWRGPYAVVAR